MDKEKPDNKAKILATSEQLFAQRGFAGVSIDEIAKEAAINKSIIYYYFTNKEDLLAHIIQKHVAEFETFFKAVRSGADKTVRGIIRELVSLAVDYMSRNADIIKILLRETLMSHPKSKIDIVKFIDPLWERTEADLRAAFPRAIKVAPLEKMMFINLIINFILILGWFGCENEAEAAKLKRAYIERVTDMAEMLIIPSRPSTKETRR